MANGDPQERLIPGQVYTAPDGERRRFKRYQVDEDGVERKVFENRVVSSRESQDPDGPKQFGSGFARTVGQGLTFGFGDEIEGAIRGALGPGTVREGIDAARQSLGEYRSAHPGTAILGELAGGLVTGVGGAAALGRTALGAGLGMGRQGAAAARAAQIADTGGGLLQNARTASKIGAAEGALYGFGAAEGDALERTRGAGFGAAAGAVAAPVVSGALGTVGKFADFGEKLTRGWRPGDSGAAARQRMVDDKFVDRLRQNDPEEFTRVADEWLERTTRTANSEVGTPATAQGDLFDTPTGFTADEISSAKQQLAEYESLGKPETYAGVRGLLDDAIAREADPAYVNRLMLDIEPNIQAAGLDAMSYQGTGPRSLLGATQARATERATGRQLKEMGRLAGLEDTGGYQARLASLGKDRATQAGTDYEAFYNIDPAEWAKTVNNPGLPGGRPSIQAMLNDLNSAFGTGKRRSELYRRIEAEMPDSGVLAANQVPPVPGAPPRPPLTTLDEIVKNPASITARDTDRLHRALKAAAKQAREDGEGRLGKNLDDFADGLDRSVVTEEYRTARKGFQVASRKIDAYEFGTKEANKTAEDIAEGLRTAHQRPGMPPQNLTPDQIASVQKEYVRGILDKIADKANGMDDASGAKFLQEELTKLFDSPNAPFAQLNTELSEEARESLVRNIRQLGSEAKATQAVERGSQRGVDKAKDIGIPEGQIQATAFGYGPGQSGAALRTLLAGAIYSKGPLRRYAQQIAGRASQGEAAGLRGLLDSTIENEATNIARLRRKPRRDILGGLLPQQSAADRQEQIGLLVPDFVPERYREGTGQPRYYEALQKRR